MFSHLVKVTTISLWYMCLYEGCWQWHTEYTKINLKKSGGRRIVKIREWLSLAISNQAFWLGRIGLGVSFKIFTARLGWSVRISQIHLQKNTLSLISVQRGPVSWIYRKRIFLVSEVGVTQTIPMRYLRYLPDIRYLGVPDYLASVVMTCQIQTG